MTSLPVAVSPVNDDIRTRGWLTSATPTGSPCPVTTLSTPSGKMSAPSSASRSAVSGVCSLGLSTSVLPAIRAGHTFQTAMLSG